MQILKSFEQNKCKTGNMKESAAWILTSPLFTIQVTLDKSQLLFRLSLRKLLKTAAKKHVR